MRRLVLICWMLIAVTGRAEAEPISLAIGAVGSYLAANAGAILLQVGIGVALSAASYGLSYLASRGGKQQQAAEQTQEVRGTPLPDFDGLLRTRRAYGTVIDGGGVFFNKTIEGAGSSAPNRWVLGLALSEGICDGLVSLIINDVECVVDAAGVPQTAPWNDGTDIWFRASFRSGADDQAMDPIIAGYWSSPPDDFFPDAADRSARWAAFRQRGVATLVLDLDYGTDADHHTELWGEGGIPNLLPKFRGLRLFDRTDARQDPDDPATWSWTDTATIAIEDYLVSGMGGALDRGEILGADAVASIDTDRRWQPTLSGREQRGRVNGVTLSTESPIDVAGAMLQQTRGRLLQSEGSYAIRSEVAAEAVATIWKGQWRDRLSFQNQPDARTAIGGVVVQFYPASRFGQASETSYPASALDDPGAQRITLNWCDSPAAAQRLGYALMTENAVARTISGTFDVSVLLAPGKANGLLEEGDVVTFDAPAPYDDQNGLYRVAVIEVAAEFTVSLSLVGTTSATINGWSKALETAYEELA